MFGEETRLKALLYAAILLTLLGYTGRYLGLEPLNNQFFAFAAWSYVLFADNLVYRFTGWSPAVSRPSEFLALSLRSLAFCCALELLNLRLGVWYYSGLPATLSTRWTGFACAWAALLPSLFVTAELLRAAGLFSGLRTLRLPVAPALPRALAAAGALALLLALAFPDFLAAPLCAAFLMIAEPLNYRLGLPSLLRELEGGLPGKTLRLALAGPACGLLWAAWNGAAGASWTCALAFPGPRLLGLPLAAWPLFSLAALQAYSLASLASALHAGRGWEEGEWRMPGPVPGPLAKGAVLLLVCAACYLALRAVDQHTVRVFLAWI
jgi:hypothetical protein